MSELLKGGPEHSPIPDVDAIMQRVQAGVADRNGRGLISAADLEAARRVEDELRQGADSGPAPADDLALLRASSDPLGPYAFTSHRAGIGALIVAAKRSLRRFIRPVAAVVLARQAEFNGAAVRLFVGESRRVHSLAAAVAALQRRADELERGNRELRARCDEMQREISALRGASAPAARTTGAE